MFTELKDRQLWYDGDSVVSPSHIINLLKRGASTDKLSVTEMIPDIEEYNRFTPPKQQIHTKDGLSDKFNFRWNLPPEIQTLDVRNYIIDQFMVLAETTDWSEEQINIRYTRIMYELSRYECENKIDVLRAIIHIVKTFEQNNTVWGVGRGSSVSSYVLYVIGVHDVDSVKYDLDFADFL